MCPACGQAMVTFDLEGVEVDHCPACKGTWLDAGELEHIAERAGTVAGRLHGALDGARAGARSWRRCPRCGKRLREAAVEGATPLTIDRCPRGDGLWFDRGELMETIRRHDDAEESAVGTFFAELYRSELRESESGLAAQGG